MSANKAFYILLATSATALIGLAGVLTKALPLNFAHAVYICQSNLSNVIGTLPHSVPLLLTFMAATILVVGSMVFVILIIKTRLFVIRSLTRATSIPRNIKVLLKRLGLDRKVDIVEDTRKLSFCYGIFKPRICLSTGLIKSLTRNELSAVLLHEKYHLKSYDPLKIIITRSARYTFFFVPLVADIQKYYALSKELAADSEVVKSGQKIALLRALSKLLVVNNTKFDGVAAFANVNNLEKRITALSRQQYKELFKLSSYNVFFSLIVLSTVFLLLNAPVHAVSMSEESMDHSFFICPFGNECLAACKKDFPIEQKNFSQVKLYTPIP